MGFAREVHCSLGESVAGNRRLLHLAMRGLVPVLRGRRRFASSADVVRRQPIAQGVVHCGLPAPRIAHLLPGVPRVRCRRASVPLALISVDTAATLAYRYLYHSATAPYIGGHPNGWLRMGFIPDSGYEAA